ncbi:MAG: hypothetical protein FWC33_02010 [Candidatus Bathyarchaeota archaeon]|nr:hypothetical protein [Candidatus Termiticorpusculum sp.]
MVATKVIEVSIDKTDGSQKKVYSITSKFIEKLNMLESECREYLIKSSFEKSREEAKEMFDEFLAKDMEQIVHDILFKILLISETPEGIAVRKCKKRGDNPKLLTLHIKQLWEKYSEEFNIFNRMEQIFWDIFSNSDIAFEGETPSIIAFLQNQTIYQEVETHIVEELLKPLWKMARKVYSNDKRIK